MILIDYNALVISELMGELKGAKELELNLHTVRHIVLNAIRKQLNRHRNEFGKRLTIACDSENNWRNDEFEHYKCLRKINKQKSVIDWDSLFVHLKTMSDELQAHFPYHTISVPRTEADDIIGVICNNAGTTSKQKFEKILIISGDKDFIQLQKFPNIFQYAPAKKDFIVTKDAQSVLIEQIIRGDSADNIPNILSPDDIFLIPHTRQKSITKKYLASKLEHPHKNFDIDPEAYIKAAFNEKEIVAFRRNNTLMNLNMIPESIKQNIFDALNTYSVAKENLISYFIKNKLNNLLENIGEF